MEERLCDHCGDLVAVKGWTAHRKAHKLQARRQRVIRDGRLVFVDDVK